MQVLICFFQGLVDVLENNEVLRCINLETNYLSGEFFAKLFRAMLKFQQIEEIKAVNQVRPQMNASMVLTM